MKFCPLCDNILLPRKKKLFCKICNIEFKFDMDQKEDYKIVINIPHNESDLSPIIVEKDLKDKKISVDDRKACGDFFTSSESSDE